MEATRKINGLTVYVGGTWAEISDSRRGVLFAGSVAENSTPEKVYRAWLRTLEPLWSGNAKKGGYYRWFNGFCRLEYIGAMRDGVPLWCEVRTSAGNVKAPVSLKSERPATYTALNFDALYADCKYRCDTEVNNGYGCDHPAQEESDENSEGEAEGCCYCWSCPLGIDFNPCDEAEDAQALKENPNIYWAGFTSEEDGGPIIDDFIDCDCLLVNDGPDETEDEQDAIRRHWNYLNRYNREI